jgi:transglutaminase-like putative cysteine protease
LVFVLAPLTLRAAGDMPDWVRQAAAQTIPAYSAKVTSVVLLKEEIVTVDPDGRRVMRERGAVKILQPSGEMPEAYRTYNVKNGRIRDFEGWLLPPTGKPSTFAKNRILDVALSRDYTYDEARAKVLEFGSAPPGSVLAWEITEEEKTVFTQDEFSFQGRSPVLISRFSLTLPQGWEARGTVFNHAPLDPQVSGSTSTWELRDLPWMEREDYSPPTSALAPRLAVSYFPPSGNASGLQGLKDWTAVSIWLSTLVDPPAEVTDAVRTKARTLTMNADSDVAKIAAIGAFVQQTNYVEVSLNITRGGGYTPHRAEESLARNYGDCKDKATLMRSLLKAVGIESFLTTITADERSYVRPEWASPMQFNHAIIAIRVPDAVAFPAVIKDSPLGRLLIFDPTDPITPVGDLPEDEQGSYALVIAGANGALLKMPLFPAESNRVESSVEATMDPGGKMTAQVRRQYFGQSGIQLRAIEKLRGADEVKKRFERGFSRRIGGTTITRVATEGRPEENRLAVQIDLSAEQFGQLMQGRLLVVHPGLLSNGGEYIFTTRQRTAPVKLEAGLRRDSIKIKVPAGFKLDELPEPARIEGPYGTLSANWKVANGEILMEQTLEIKEKLAAAAEYPQVRDFFDKVAGAQAAPVVFIRQ